MEKKTYSELVASWIAYQQNWWAYEALEKLIQDNPNDAWNVIRTIFEKIKDYKTMGSLAAGPLEDLLSMHGENVIGDIEAYTESNPEFRKCLSGVWRNEMTNKLYSRVKSLADPNFKFE